MRTGSSLFLDHQEQHFPVYDSCSNSVVDRLTPEMKRHRKFSIKTYRDNNSDGKKCPATRLKGNTRSTRPPCWPIKCFIHGRYLSPLRLSDVRLHSGDIWHTTLVWTKTRMMMMNKLSSLPIAGYIPFLSSIPDGLQSRLGASEGQSWRGLQPGHPNGMPLSHHSRQDDRAVLSKQW